MRATKQFSLALRSKSEFYEKSFKSPTDTLYLKILYRRVRKNLQRWIIIYININIYIYILIYKLILKQINSIKFFVVTFI